MLSKTFLGKLSDKNLWKFSARFLSQIKFGRTPLNLVTYLFYVLFLLGTHRSIYFILMWQLYLAIACYTLPSMKYTYLNLGLFESFPVKSRGVVNFTRSGQRLTFSWRRLLSYRNQSIDFLCKSMDWFLYDNGLRHERVKITVLQCRRLRWVFFQKNYQRLLLLDCRDVPRTLSNMYDEAIYNNS